MEQDDRDDELRCIGDRGDAAQQSAGEERADQGCHDPVREECDDDRRGFFFNLRSSDALSFITAGYIIKNKQMPMGSTLVRPSRIDHGTYTR